MASLKRYVRLSREKPNLKEDTTTDGVLELSVTVGYLAADVKIEELGKMERLLVNHCVAGLVALERGDIEQHLHFQMVCQARVKSARSFGILVRKYMDWHALKQMSPAGKVTCKVLTNRLLHTWKGMLGYCLKDTGLEHFQCVMHNISEDDVVVGKTLHSIYGKSDLKTRVVLTNKNVGDRAYVWYKYKENRQLTTTMLSTLTDMINSAMFIPSTAWIIPITGLGMEQRRMNSFWKCLTDPANVDRSEVADVFIRKREYVRGRYHDEELTVPCGNSVNEFVFQGNIVDDSMKVERSDSPTQQMKDRVIVGNCRKKLFEEPLLPHRPAKSVKFADTPCYFIPLKNMAPLPTNVYLPTFDGLEDSCQTKIPMSEAQFWENLTNVASDCIGSAGKKTVADDVGGSSGEKKSTYRHSSEEEVQQKIVIELSSDSEDDRKGTANNAIDISSDSDDYINKSKSGQMESHQHSKTGNRLCRCIIGEETLPLISLKPNQRNTLGVETVLCRAVEQDH